MAHAQRGRAEPSVESGTPCAPRAARRARWVPPADTGCALHPAQHAAAIAEVYRAVEGAGFLVR